MRVFISSPYTNGDVARNVRRQIDIADQLMDLGHTPFLPLLSHFQHLVHPRSYHDWLMNDMEWLKVSDCILRLSGESAGADLEEECAKEIKKPIYYSINELPRISAK